jgi:5-(carboxyamino)imidazole ribonucleotide synthase
MTNSTSSKAKQIKTMGVVGGGQLGRMMALAAAKLDIQCIFLDPSADCCGAQYGELIQAPYDDEVALKELAERCDVITFEFESVPSQAVEFLSQYKPARPAANVLEVARDRWNEKSLFAELGIPLPKLGLVDSQADLEKAVASVGLPAVLKTRTLGYDGKGQKVLKTDADVAGTFVELGEVPMILEGFVNFDYEVSAVVVRDTQGSCRFYPLSENVHKQGILYKSVALNDHPLQAKAEKYSKAVLEALDYVGVMAFEFFVQGDELIANEIAPRVHNSGHWSIEGALCSQFENHVRAVCELPVGSCDAPNHVAMINLIGALPSKQDVCAVAGASYHDYGKLPKPGRKVAHITVVAKEQADFDESIAKIEALVKNIL